MTMTNDWTNAAAHFGLSPEDAAAHWTAWQDLERLRPAAFVEDTFQLLKTLVDERQRTGQPPDPAALRQLTARRDIIAAFTEDAAKVVNEERLQAFLVASTQSGLVH